MSQNKLTPRYTHDCSLCTFLGMFREYDIYVHDTNEDGYPTIIARYGDEGPDYASGFYLNYDEVVPPISVFKVAAAMVDANRTLDHNEKELENDRLQA